jgi:hypothetical protein
MGRNSADFHGYNVFYEGRIYSSLYGTGPEPEVHSVVARHPDKGQVGHLYWHPDSGEIKDVLVQGEHEGKGLGTQMYKVAQSASKSEGLPTPEHSPVRTKAGDAWAKKVGGKVPPLKEGRFHDL